MNDKTVYYSYVKDKLRDHHSAIVASFFTKLTISESPVDRPCFTSSPSG